MEKVALVVFAKEPIAGTVKTRLAATLGDQKAAQIYQKLLQYTLLILNQFEHELFVYLTPSSSDIFLKNPVYPNRIKRRFQVEGNLGEKMSAMFEELFNEGLKKIILVGSDCPFINSSHIREAVDALDEHETTWGPSLDGGYYLVGQREKNRKLFDRIPWSTEKVWELTRKKIKENNYSFHLLEKLSDIDTEEDLIAFSNSQHLSHPIFEEVLSSISNENC